MKRNLFQNVEINTIVLSNFVIANYDLILARVSINIFVQQFINISLHQ